jgi:hypothetical protein
MSGADPLPPDESLDRRVTTGLAKIGIALKQRPGPRPVAAA